MRCSRSSNAGFTLVEVMAAGVVLGILALGLSQMWAVAGERSIDTTTRQKAVFVLNGQMERLSALYSVTALGSVTANDTTGYGSPVDYPDARAIFRMNTNTFMESGVDAFVTDSLATFEASNEAFVFLDDQGGTAADRNYVWIDQDRRILGRLSWAESDIPGAANGGGGGGGGGSLSGLCFDYAGGTGGDNCREITLILEFPFRLVNDVPTAGEALRIMPLKTIVGRWR